MSKSPSPFTGMKLTDQTPIAKTGVDQKLFSTPPPVPPVVPETQANKDTPARLQTRKRAKLSLSPALPDSEMVEKYTTHIEPSLVKKIKLAAIEKDMKDYDVVRLALNLYFENNK